MSRVYNFSAGPSCLPLEVLEEAAAEMTDWRGSGQSVMEMSHRSAAWESIIQGAEEKIRRLMNIPSDYSVLFLQGGASQQFAMIPMNLKKKGVAAYTDTGIWAAKAIEEAARYLCVETAASTKAERYRLVPRDLHIGSGYDYAHITLNNTIMGTRWKNIPEVDPSVPLVADISSSVLSEPLDVSRFGLLYAGAQKNLAPAGLTLVIIRKDLIPDTPAAGTPTMLSYKTHADHGSMYNTPPCYTIYMMDKVLSWIEKNGGAAGMKKRNEEKAGLLYDYLDSSSFYAGTADPESRSLMNITFVIREENKARAQELHKRFTAQAEEAGLINLAGHRIAGGMRASIYNAMDIEGVRALISFMDRFAAAHQGSL